MLQPSRWRCGISCLMCRSTFQEIFVVVKSYSTFVVNYKRRRVHYFLLCDKPNIRVSCNYTYFFQTRSYKFGCFFRQSKVADQVMQIFLIVWSRFDLVIKITIHTIINVYYAENISCIYSVGTVVLG